MGENAMSRVTLFLLLLTAFVEVFLECWFDGFRRVLGAQISLLPALTVYAGLTSSLAATSLMAFCGGLWYDSLSVNPLGISVLPLIIVGWSVYWGRDFCLRDQTVAQLFSGAVGSLVAPLLTLLLLYTLMPSHPSGSHSGLNWESMPTVEGGMANGGAAALRPSLSWQMAVKLAVMTGAGALATPFIFRMFDFLNRHFNYAAAPEASFRPDRQIVRGRR